MSERKETPEEKERRVNRKIWMTVTPVLFFIAAVIYFDKPDNECRDYQAYEAAKLIIKKHLKSPSSAKFAVDGVDQVSIQPLGGCRFRVASHVDSQNSFGAMLRTNFYITVRRDGNGNDWVGSDMSLF
ncbi:hypothetical protein [Metapseudomonas sp. CR1201]